VPVGTFVSAGAEKGRVQPVPAVVNRPDSHPVWHRPSHSWQARAIVGHSRRIDRPARVLEQSTVGRRIRLRRASRTRHLHYRQQPERGRLLPGHAVAGTVLQPIGLAGRFSALPGQRGQGLGPNKRRDRRGPFAAWTASANGVDEAQSVLATAVAGRVWEWSHVPGSHSHKHARDRMCVVVDARSSSTHERRSTAVA
jgi:hypothetical protein